MAKHTPMCLLMSLLVVVGAVNWGLSGLGMLLKMNLNVVNLLLGSLAGGVVEAVVYILVGLAGLMFGYVMLTMKECGCQTMNKK